MMATKKSATKSAGKKSTIIKIAETIGMVAGEISVKKDKVIAIASNVIGSMKSKGQDSAKSQVPEKKEKKSAPSKSINAGAQKKTATKKSTAVVAKQNRKSPAAGEGKIVKKAEVKKSTPTKKITKQAKKKSTAPQQSKTAKQAGTGPKKLKSKNKITE